MKILVPKCADGCLPALTATYSCAALANMFSTAHFPRGGVLEMYSYETGEED